MYSTKLSVGIHILSVVALSDNKPITSSYVAQSINTNPALVRRLIGKLKDAHLIFVCNGRTPTYRCLDPDDINLWQIFEAVEADQTLYNIHSDTNQHCPIGASIQAILSDTFSHISEELRRQLEATALSSILKRIKQSDENFRLEEL